MKHWTQYRYAQPIPAQSPIVWMIAILKVLSTIKLNYIYIFIYVYKYINLLTLAIFLSVFCNLFPSNSLSEFLSCFATPEKSQTFWWKEEYRMLMQASYVFLMLNLITGDVSNIARTFTIHHITTKFTRRLSEHQRIFVILDHKYWIYIRHASIQKYWRNRKAISIHPYLISIIYIIITF